MKPAITRISAILMALLMVVSLLPAAVFAVSDRTVTYEVQDNSGAQVTKFTKDTSVSVVVRVSDSTMTLDPLAPAEDQLHAYKLSDSFWESSQSAVSYSIVSPTEYTVSFAGQVYSGTGQSFVFKTSENNKVSYSKESLTIDEAVVYVAPPADPEPEYEPPTPCDPPVVIISVVSAPEIIKAGDEFEVKLNVENKSTRPLSDVYANFTTTGDYRIDGYTTKVAVDNIGAKKNVDVVAKFKASDSLDAEYVTLGAEVQYTYYNYIQTTNGSASETFYLTAQKKAKEEEEPPKEVIPEPVVIVTGSVIEPITAKKEFEYTVTFDNKGKTALTNPVVKLSCGNDLTLKNESTTLLIPDIAAGAKGTVTLKLKAADTITSPMQDVSVSMKYYYDDGRGVVNTIGNVSENFSLAANVTQQGEGPTIIASPVPNVIITDYSFGGESVVAGEPFDLNVTFKNTGRVAIENIVVVLNGGQHFTINGATNTVYYNSVGAGAEQTLTVPLQTLATAATGAQPVAVSFQYEYVDNKVRSQNSANIDISVPVSQPDRLEFGEPVMYDWMAYTGMETTIVLEYVNKGKSEVSNVEAEVIGNVDALQQSQYLGNFGSGMSGNISFVVTPWEAGMTDVTFNITYEDANGKTVTREIPYSFEVQDMSYDDPGQWEDPGMWEDPVPEKQGFFQTMPWWGWVIAAVVLLAVLIIVLKSIKKGKAKKAVKAAESEWNVFDEVGENKEA